MQETVLSQSNKTEYFLWLTNNNENTILCPACSHLRKKKSLKCLGYNAQKGTGKCNHCGEVFFKKNDNYMKPENIAYTKPKLKSDGIIPLNVLEWFDGRKIGQKTLNDFKIGYGVEWMPQTRTKLQTIQFNYFENSELVNVKYRSSQKHFKLVKDAKMVFYNIDAIRNENEIIIVEGEMDCLAMYEAGIKNVISVPNGCTEKGKINMEYLDNCIDYFEGKSIVLALDNDFVGNRLKDEIARRLGFENCTIVTFKDCKDANDCLIKYGISGIIESLNKKVDFPIVGVFTASDINTEIDDYYNNGLPAGDGIGLYNFDNNLKFHKGYITTITGVPGHGKSEFLDFISAKLNINHGWKFAMYSPENYPLQLHFSKYAEKFIGKPFSGPDKLNPMELRLAKNYFEDNFYFIKPESDFSLDNIMDKVRQLVKKKGIDAFIIDAWNKIEHHYTTNETKYISEVLDKLSLFCEANMVHLFLVAHPTKVMKDKKTGLIEVPNLYSISGSANFYNKTSNGITVYLNRLTFKTEIHIQKVKFKHWGQVGLVEMFWNKLNGRYYENCPDNDNWINKTEQSQMILEPAIKPNAFWDSEVITKGYDYNDPASDGDAPF